jgi:hypothetical protein
MLLNLVQNPIAQIVKQRKRKPARSGAALKSLAQKENSAASR